MKLRRANVANRLKTVNRRWNPRNVSTMEESMHAFRRRAQDAVSMGTASCLLVLAIGCETNPYTGRSQFLMTSVSEEMKMGEQAYTQVKNDPKMKASQDPREIEPVKRVTSRIIDAAKRSKYADMAKQFQWEVTVI